MRFAIVRRTGEYYEPDGRLVERIIYENRAWRKSVRTAVGQDSFSFVCRSIIFRNRRFISGRNRFRMF